MLCSCCGHNLTQAQARYMDTPLGRRVVCPDCQREMNEIYEALAEGDGEAVMEALKDAVGTE